MNCPICNTIVEDTYKNPFCPTCQWELVLIPEETSPEMRKYFFDRQKTFRDCYQSIKEKQTLEREFEKIISDITSLNEIITNKISLLQSKEQILERLNSVPAELKTTRESIKSLQEEITRLRMIAAHSQNYQSDLKALKVAFEQVVHLGYREQVKKAEAFLKSKGII